MLPPPSPRKNISLLWVGHVQTEWHEVAGVMDVLPISSWNSQASATQQQQSTDRPAERDGQLDQEREGGVWQNEWDWHKKKTQGKEETEHWEDWD